jgi:hypothetical protein
MYTIVKTKLTNINGTLVWVEVKEPKSNSADLEQGAIICLGLNETCPANECYHLSQGCC